MALDTESQMIAAKIAFDLLAAAYADLAQHVRDNPDGVRTGIFNTIEQALADRLRSFMAENPSAAARPDILGVAAQMARLALRAAHGARDATGLPN